MGIAHRADRSLGCTVSVWDGDVGVEDVQQHLIALAGDRDWPPGLLHLTDLTTIGTVSVPDPELVALLYEGTNLSEELRVALVVRPEALDKPDVRFASAAREVKAQLFTDLTLACANLGVDSTAVAATIEQLRAELTHRQP